jgi:hypothetical protein
VKAIVNRAEFLIPAFASNVHEALAAGPLPADLQAILLPSAAEYALRFELTLYDQALGSTPLGTADAKAIYLRGPYVQPPSERAGFAAAQAIPNVPRTVFAEKPFKDSYKVYMVAQGVRAAAVAATIEYQISVEKLCGNAPC